MARPKQKQTMSVYSLRLPERLRKLIKAEQKRLAPTGLTEQQVCRIAIELGLQCLKDSPISDLLVARGAKVIPEK